MEIVDQEGEEDGLELGESCGQAKMRGRADMPLAASGSHHHGGGGNGEDGAMSAESSEWELSGASSSFMEQSTSSFLGTLIRIHRGKEGSSTTTCNNTTCTGWNHYKCGRNKH